MNRVFKSYYLVLYLPIFIFHLFYSSSWAATTANLGKLSIDINGNVAIVWEGTDLTTGNSAIYVAMSKDNWINHQIFLGEVNQVVSFSQVRLNDSGDLLVAWVNTFQDGTNTIQTARNPSISGTWTLDIISDPALDSQVTNFMIVLNNSGNAAISWYSFPLESTVPEFRIATGSIQSGWNTPISLSISQ